MHKARAVAQKILIIFLSVVLLLNLYLFAMQVIFGKQLPKLFGMAQIIVVSGSMEPAVQVGDLLVIREQDRYEDGDIITYRSEQSLITHRIISVKENSIITQGDANNVADAPITPSQVEGKMLLRVPGLGRAILFIKTPIGILAALVSGLILIAISIIADRKKKPEQD